MSQLSKDDLSLLESCPQVIMNFSKHGITPSAANRRRLERVKRLWAAGFVKGEIPESGQSFTVVLQDKGRQALAEALPQRRRP